MKNIKLAEAFQQIGNGFVTLGEALALDDPSHVTPTALEAQTAAPAVTEPAKGTRKTAKPKETPEVTAPALSPVGQPVSKELDAAAATLVSAAEIAGITHPAITIDDVRPQFVKFANPELTPAGGMEKAKALLAQYDVTSLGKLDPKHYPAFLESIKAASAAVEPDITA